MKGRWEQEAGNPGSDTLGDSGNICRADGLGQWPRSPQSEPKQETQEKWVQSLGRENLLEEGMFKARKVTSTTS